VRRLQMLRHILEPARLVIENGPAIDPVGIVIVVRAVPKGCLILLLGAYPVKGRTNEIKRSN